MGLGWALGALNPSILLLPAERHVGPMTTALGLSQLFLARFVFMRTIAFDPNAEQFGLTKCYFQIREFRSEVGPIQC